MPVPMHLPSSHTSLFWTSFFCGHSSQRCYRLITPPNTSSFVSGRSGKLHPWLAHLASMLRNCLTLSRKHPDLFAYSVLPFQHMSQRFKSLIRTKACDLEAPCHCLKKSVLLFTLCAWLVMKFHHDVSFTCPLIQAGTSQWASQQVCKAPPDFWVDPPHKEEPLFLLFLASLWEPFIIKHRCDGMSYSTTCWLFWWCISASVTKTLALPACFTRFVFLYYCLRLALFQAVSSFLQTVCHVQMMWPCEVWTGKSNYRTLGEKQKDMRV